MTEDQFHGTLAAVGMIPPRLDPEGGALIGSAALRRLADIWYAAGVAAEREECAKVCDEAADQWHPDHQGTAATLAANIRARGQE